QDWRFPLIHPFFALRHLLSRHRDTGPGPSGPPSIQLQAENLRWQGIPARPQENGRLPKNQSAPRTVYTQHQPTLAPPIAQRPARCPPDISGAVRRSPRLKRASAPLAQLLRHEPSLSDATAPVGITGSSAQLSRARTSESSIR